LFRVGQGLFPACQVVGPDGRCGRHGGSQGFDFGPQGGVTYSGLAFGRHQVKHGHQGICRWDALFAGFIERCDRVFQHRQDGCPGLG
jgi:hypothetical protein